MCTSKDITIKSTGFDSGVVQTLASSHINPRSKDLSYYIYRYSVRSEAKLMLISLDLAFLKIHSFAL